MISRRAPSSVRSGWVGGSWERPPSARVGRGERRGHATRTTPCVIYGFDPARPGPDGALPRARRRYDVQLPETGPMRMASAIWRHSRVGPSEPGMGGGSPRDGVSSAWGWRSGHAVVPLISASTHAWQCQRQATRSGGRCSVSCVGSPSPGRARGVHRRRGRVVRAGVAQRRPPALAGATVVHPAIAVQRSSAGSRRCRSGVEDSGGRAPRVARAGELLTSGERSSRRGSSRWRETGIALRALSGRRRACSTCRRCGARVEDLAAAVDTLLASDLADGSSLAGARVTCPGVLAAACRGSVCRRGLKATSSSLTPPGGFRGDGCGSATGGSWRGSSGGRSSGRGRIDRRSSSRASGSSGGPRTRSPPDPGCS